MMMVSGAAMHRVRAVSSPAKARAKAKTKPKAKAKAKAMKDIQEYAIVERFGECSVVFQTCLVVL